MREVAKTITLSLNIFLADRIAQVVPAGGSEAETVQALIELGLKVLEASPDALTQVPTPKYRPPSKRNDDAVTVVHPIQRRLPQRDVSLNDLLVKDQDRDPE